MPSVRIPLLALSLLLGSFVSCAGAPIEQPPPAVPEPAPMPSPPPAAPAASSMQFASELGSIDEDELEGVFRSLEVALQDCHRKGMKRVKYLGGDVRFFLRVGPQGRAKVSHLAQSTLGDFETERCMLQVVSQAEWPKPIGGDAEVKKSLGFDPPSDIKRPVAWSASVVKPIADRIRPHLRKCLAHTHGEFLVTAYVVPEGRKGRVHAAGISPPAPESERQAECVVESVKQWKMPSPGRAVAKVTFLF